MYDSTFTPDLGGSTHLIGTNPEQITGSKDPVTKSSYRVRCLVTGYISWSPKVNGSDAQPSNFSAVAPANAAPSTNTMGMTAGTVESFGFPRGAWFVSSVAAGFEVTGGEGL